MPKGISLYEEARLQGRLWTPRVFNLSTDVSFWIDFSDYRTVYGSGTSFNDPQVTVAVGCQNGASWVPTSQYGRAMAVLGGSPQYIVFSSQFSVNMTTGIAGFAVAEQNGSATTRTILGAINTSNGSPQLRYAPDHTLQFINAKVAALVTGGNVAAQGLNVCGYQAYTNFSGAYLNGAANENTTNPGISQSNSSVGHNGDTEYFVGLVGEFITFRRKVTALERAKVEGYLAWKWRIQDRLTTGHLYRWAPPLLGV